MAGPLIAAKVITAGQAVLENIQKARDWVDSSPEDLGPLERMGRAGVIGYCRAVQRLPLGGYSFGLGAGVATQYVCAPVYDEPGSLPDGGLPAPPFSGGQCVTNYLVRLAVLATFSNGTTIRSPLSGDDIGGGEGPLTLQRFENPTAVGWAFVRTNGTFVLSRSVNPNSVPGATLLRVDTVIASATRTDGLPDNCGDQDPIYVPPVPATPYDWDEPIPTGPGLPPVRVPDPTDRERPGIDIDFGDGSGISIDFGGDGSASPAPPAGKPEDSATQDGSPVSPGEDGEYDFGNPPEGSEWVGYRWILSYDPVIYGGIVGSAPEWVSPRALGNGALRVSATVGSSGSFLGDTIVINRVVGAQFRSVGGVRVEGCKFSVFPTIPATVIPVSAPLPPED